MKASICLLLGVAVFSTLFLESSTASTGDDGVIGGVLGGVGDLLKKLLAQLLGAVTTDVGIVTGLITDLGNEVGTFAQNTTGTTKVAVTKLLTIIDNFLDTAAKIPQVLATGTTESLNEGLDLTATLNGLLEQIVDTLAGNPEIADLLNNADAVLEKVPGLLESITNSIVQVQVSV